MGTIATGLQTLRKDCYATSDRVKLTLRTNGEERNSVIAPGGGAPVIAGFDEPETIPTGVVSGGGTLSGHYVYAYVYASTKYPYVENAVTTADGELWPRSNPSPMSAVQNCSAGTRTVTLTVTKTTRSDVDKILIYRTQSASTSAAAQALADAGTLYYIGEAINNGSPGTTTFEDDGIPDTGEALELDNYTADTAEFCEFDGTYWWTCASPLFTATVTLDGTSAVTISGESWFDGRDGQIATFDGISTGGFDGAGSWYLKVTGTTTGVLYADQELTVPKVVPFSGTTTIRVRGLTNILYRSKPFNPFSWGLTQTQVGDDGAATTQIPQSFALNLGGGAITAMAISPNGKRLMVHFENPQRTITLDLEQAESEDFGATQQILDNTGSVTCHFTLFNGMIGNKPMLLGFDHYNGNVLASDGYEQVVISEPMGDFLYSNVDTSDGAPKFFHGCYDAGTELNCFWLRLYDTDERNNIKVWMHAPSGQWGWMPDFDVLCSGTVLDDETGERLVVGGTDLGFFGQVLALDTFQNWNALPTWFSTDRDTVLQMNLATWLGDLGDDDMITQTSPSTGVFRVSRLTFSVQQIVLVDLFTTGTPTEYTVQSILKVSDSLWEVTLTTPYVEDLNGLAVAMHPRYFENSPCVVLNSAAGVSPGVTSSFTNAWYVWLDYIGFNGDDAPYFTVASALEVGESEFEDVSVTVPWASVAEPMVIMGGIPCLFRSYFDLSTPTIDKKSCEVWLTAKQFGENTLPLSGSEYRLLAWPAFRFYYQFSDTWNSAIYLQRDVLPGENQTGSSSLAYYNKTQVPSVLLKSFGVEFLEVAQNNVDLYNFTVKVEETA